MANRGARVTLLIWRRAHSLLAGLPLPRVAPGPPPRAEPDPTDIQRRIINRDQKIRTEIAFLKPMHADESGAAPVHVCGRLEQEH